MTPEQAAELARRAFGDPGELVLLRASDAVTFRGPGAIVRVTPAALRPRGASTTTGSARPSPKARPSTRPAIGSPSARATAASAGTAKVSTNVVKPIPSSTP